MNKKIRKEILHKRNQTCQSCKKTFEGRDLCIHHKDGKKKNNSLKNLILCCRSCHMKIHHWQLPTDIKQTIMEIKKIKPKNEIEKEFLKIKIKLWEDKLYEKEKPFLLKYL